MLDGSTCQPATMTPTGVLRWMSLTLTLQPLRTEIRHDSGSFMRLTQACAGFRRLISWDNICMDYCHWTQSATFRALGMNRDDQPCCVLQ